MTMIQKAHEFNEKCECLYCQYAKKKILEYDVSTLIDEIPYDAVIYVNQSPGKEWKYNITIGCVWRVLSRSVKLSALDTRALSAKVLEVLSLVSRRTRLGIGV